MTGTISYGGKLKRLRDFLAIFLVAAMVFGAYELFVDWLHLRVGIYTEVIYFGSVFLLSALVAAIGYGVLMRMGSLSAERDRDRERAGRRARQNSIP